jgi:dolichyl-phosphate-mannose--protein O-mannosyl transferase
MRTNITTFLVLLAMYQLFVSTKVLLSSQYTVKQRIFQIINIWFIPFFGALLCHYVVLQDQHLPRVKKSTLNVDDNHKSNALHLFTQDRLDD